MIETFLGREVRLIYSDYDEPPSETDVEYDGRPWCSIFGDHFYLLCTIFYLLNISVKFMSKILF